MLKTRVPLDKIYRVFFCNDQYSDDDSDDMNSSSDENKAPVIMNDYTVIKLGEKPVPEKPPIPKYPKFKRTVIHNEAPSAFYAIKIPPEPVPEYVPPAKKTPRKIIPENFQKNPYKREFCGKTPFEQDLLIIQHKRDTWEQHHPCKPDPNELRPEDYKTKPPKMYIRETEERRRTKEEMDRQVMEELERAAKKEEKRRRKFERESEKLRMQRIERREIMSSEMEQRREEQREWEREEKKRIKEKWSNFNPNRPTRASQLKDESCRRKMERMYLEERREKLSEEMRKEVEKEQMKRLSATLLRLKPSDQTKKSAEKMRREMQKNTRLWNRWLKLTEQDIGRQTMLERIFDEAENLQFAKEEKAEMIAEQNKNA